MYSQVFGCFDGTFKLQMREGSWPYQAPPIRVAYALQGLLKEDLDWLQKQNIIAALDADETSEWCNIFVLIPKANGMARLCLDLPTLNKVLVRPIHRGLILSDILPRLVGSRYFTLIDSCCDTQQGAEDMQTEQPEDQQRQVPVQVYKHAILQWGSIKIPCEPRS